MVPREPPPPRIRIESVDIDRLCHTIDSGELRVPDFKRPFVWTPSDMLTLFDGIRKGYPIGSFLVWETDEPVESADRIGPLPAAPAPGPRSLVGYVLDGQQRLATLYGALRLPSDSPQGPLQHAWQWWIYYDLRERRFLHLPRGDRAPTEIPLRALLRTRDFLAEMRPILASFPDDEARALVDGAESLAQRIKSYQVQIVRVQGATAAQAVEIFARLNTSGQRMTADQMLTALTYRPGARGFNLSHWIREALDALGEYGFDTLDLNVVVKALLVAAGGTPYRMDLEEATRLVRSLPESVLKDALEGMQAAAKFLLHRFNATSALLPYSQQFVLLAEFFRRCPKPDPEQEAKLAKWFWATSFSGWFAAANPNQIRLALKDLQTLAEDATSNLTEHSPELAEPCRPFPRTFDLRSSRVRALLLTMFYELVPQGADGKPLHPGLILSIYGAQAFPMIFRHAPPELRVSPANRILFPLRDREPLPPQLARLSPDILASHGIDAAARVALEAGDAAAFITARAHHLARIERDFMVELGLTPPAEELGESDIDTGDD